jgi:DNA repair exonuclease SbcCD ATPase subunit
LLKEKFVGLKEALDQIARADASKKFVDDWIEARQTASTTIDEMIVGNEELAASLDRTEKEIADLPPVIERLREAHERMAEASDAALTQQEEDWRRLGITSTEQLERIAQQAEETYERFKDSRSLVVRDTALLRKLQAERELLQRHGKDLEEDDLQTLQTLEAQLERSSQKKVGFWDNYFQQVSQIYDRFAQKIANTIVDLFFGGGEEKRRLQEARAELEAELAERERAWVEYQQTTAEQLEELRRQNQEQLVADTADVVAELGERMGAWLQYRQDLEAQAQAAVQEHQTELDRETRQILAELEERRQAYEENRADLLEQVEEVTRANRRGLEERLQDLEDNLRDQVQRYEDFVTDAQQRLDALNEDSTDAISDRKRTADRRTADLNKRLKREEADIKQQIERLTKEDKEGNAERIRDLQKRLKRSRADHAENVRRVKEDLEDWTKDHQRKLERQRRDLQESLDRRQRDHEEFLDKNQADREEATRKADEQLQKRVGDLKERLDDADDEWERYENSITGPNGKLAQITQRHEEELDATLRDLRSKLNDADAEWEEYRDSVTGPGGILEQIKAKALEELGKQETDLKNKLGDMETDFENFRDAAFAELEQIDKDEAGLSIWSKMRKAAHDMLFGQDGVLASFIQFAAMEGLKNWLRPAFDALGGLLKKIPLIGAALGKVFGGGGGAPSLPVPTPGPGGGGIPGGGGGTPGIPGGATGIGFLIGGPVGAAIGAAVDVGIQVAKLLGGMRRETTLNAIEWNTRANSLYNLASLMKLNEFLPVLKDLFDNFMPLTGETGIFGQMHRRLQEIGTKTGGTAFNTGLIGTDVVPVLWDIRALLGGPLTERITARQPLLVQVVMPDGSVLGNALVADLNDTGVTP